MAVTDPISEPKDVEMEYPKDKRCVLPCLTIRRNELIVDSLTIMVNLIGC